ncbi:hypothetical protein pipiens_003437, partial [Culex pipiens pipiens]
WKRESFQSRDQQELARPVPRRHREARFD